MKMIDDWKRVTAISYSFWFTVAGVLVLIAPELIYAGWGIDTDPRIWWLSGLGLLMASLIGRVMEQTGSVLRNLLRIAAVVLLIVLTSITAARAAPPNERDTLAIAEPLVARFEGLRLVAYLPTPNDVWTIGYGHTEGVYPGMRITEAEARAMLRKELIEFRNGLHRYWTAETLQSRLPPTRDAAFLSFAYNVGVGGAGRSTAVRRINAGDIPGGCAAIGWWNKQGQRVLRGLVVRRAEEVALCRL